MKGFFQILAVGLLAVDSAMASKCRPSPSPSVSSSASSSSSISSSSGVISSSSSLPIPSSSSSIVSSSSSIVASSSSVISSSSSVSSTSSSAMASPSAPCVETVVNGNFANGLADWSSITKGPGGSTAFSNQCSADYADCGELIIAGTGDEADIYQAINVVPGVDYTLSVVYSFTYPGPDAPVNPDFSYAVYDSPPTRRRSVHLQHPRDFDSDGNVGHWVPIPIPINSNSTSSSKRDLPVLNFFSFSSNVLPNTLPFYLRFHLSGDSPISIFVASISLLPAHC